jgi:hypothetical protein
MILKLLGVVGLVRVTGDGKLVGHSSHIEYCRAFGYTVLSYGIFTYLPSYTIPSHVIRF